MHEKGIKKTIINKTFKNIKEESTSRKYERNKLKTAINAVNIDLKIGAGKV